MVRTEEEECDKYSLPRRALTTPCKGDAKNVITEKQKKYPDDNKGRLLFDIVNIFVKIKGTKEEWN